MKKSMIPIVSPQARREWEEIKDLQKKIYELFGKSRLAEALKLAAKTYKKFPRNRYAALTYAVMLGDHKVGLSKARIERNFRTSARITRSLLRRSRGLSPRSVNTIKNEYYWFSRQHYRQYRLGVMALGKLGNVGNFSMGVGACMLAIKNYEGKKPKEAKRWATKAVAACREYVKGTPSFYGGQYWLGYSLGLSGCIKDMEMALAKAAKMSGRSRNYPEFQKVRRRVQLLLKL